MTTPTPASSRGGQLPAGSVSSSLGAVLADPTGVTVDTTTYANSVTGAGKLTTIVFPVDTAAFAIALAGDTFPRWLWLSDAGDGFYFGTGAQDPYATAGGFVQAGSRQGQKDVLGVNSKVIFGSTMLATGTGAPVIGANVGDYYFRRDTPGTPLQRLYVCTVAGVAGAATWVGIL